MEKSSELDQIIRKLVVVYAVVLNIDVKQIEATTSIRPLEIIQECFDLVPSIAHVIDFDKVCLR